MLYKSLSKLYQTNQSDLRHYCDTTTISDNISSMNLKLVAQPLIFNKPKKKLLFCNKEQNNNSRRATLRPMRDKESL